MMRYDENAVEHVVSNNFNPYFVTQRSEKIPSRVN